MANNEASFILKLIDMVTGPANKIANSLELTTKSVNLATVAADNLSKKTNFNFNQATIAIQNVSEALTMVTGPGLEFESSLAELSAIAGKTGKDLDLIADAARRNAIAFGGEASDALNSYQNLLGKLGPAIADNPAALEAMGNNVQLLATTMGGDVLGATDALTTAMLQYGVDLSDPIKASESMAVMMDIMTAGAQAGGAEVKQIAASLKVAGLSAKNAGLSFQETNGVIQTLALGSLEGAEAGTIFRNMMGKMAKDRFIEPSTAAELTNAGVDIKKLSDTTLPFMDRLKELQKIQGDTALVSKFFDEANVSGVQTILKNLPAYDEFTKKASKLGTTHEMASIIMNTTKQRMAEMMAQIKDVGISIFDATKTWLPYMQVVTQGIELQSKLAPAISWVGENFGKIIPKIKSAAIASWEFVKASAMSAWQALKTAGSMAMAGITAIGSFVMPVVTATFAMLGLNTAMLANPAGAMIVGLLAIGAAVALVITYWDEILDFFIGIGEWFVKHHPFMWILDLIDNVFPGFKEYLKNLFTDIFSFFSKLWEKVVGIFSKVKSFFVGGTVAMPNIGDGTIDFGATSTTDLLNKTTTPSDLTKKDKETKIAGDEGKSRIVNLRIDKVEIINKISGDLNQGLANFEERVAQVFVAAARDAEIILSNG